MTNWEEKCCRAILLVNAKIENFRRLTFWQKALVTSTHFRIHVRTTRSLKIITETQPGDILIVAAQLGLRHRGRSPRRVREMYTVNEFGLGSLEAGSIILTHPERLGGFLELSMDCPGDEFAPNVDDGHDAKIFSGTPNYGFDIGGIKYRIYDFSAISGRSGSATGFLPTGV